MILVLIIAAFRPARESREFPQIIDTLISDSVQDWFGDQNVPVGDQTGDRYDDFLVTANPSPILELFSKEERS